ncbi:MAG TPA: DNA polymerase III subunit alpha [Thiobacillaceae bacterium]|nr:DNA polymerase III subunit alpha [Thiobacillaceae bacterium]HNU63007.1 DNA polymerase III subunit alpha [Thiobacillaceae bacterium]
MSGLPPVPAFVHLRLHSEYSIQDGLLRVDEAIRQARADGMPALALTDLANVFGLIKFYSAARRQGIKPIAGCDVWVATPETPDKPSRLLLLVQDDTGWRNLCELLTRAYRGNMHRGRALLRPEWCDGGAADGLIALSGGHLGDVGQALLNDSRDAARRLALAWAARFPDRYYLEIQRDGRPECELHLGHALDLAEELDLPVVATHPVEFPTREDYTAHETRVCIAEGYTLADKRRPRAFTPEDYFKTQAEMQALFADLPEALENTLEIARRCNLTLELGKSRLPDFPTPNGLALDEHLRAQARQGLSRRLAALYPDAPAPAEKQAEYTARLELELDTIIQMGFPGYFLIVADFINWGKNNGVPVGPGRGSGAGSLVAYALGITDLDPLAYALLFERFLNPERVSMPDFDIDFCQDNRWRVIEYVREKYGAEAVSQIATFGAMAARAVIRDVGRVLDLGYNFCDQLSKMIPSAPGKNVSLDEALEQVPELRARYEQEEEVKALFDLARKLEGLTRNVGMHAGGVLIAPGRLTDFCPLYNTEGSDSVVSQFDKDDVEKVGLVKFDFLGLRNLTIIDLAIKYIQALEPGLELDLATLPFTDPAAYDILKKANTTAIFQVESEGMKKLLVKLEPDRFEDIIAVLALYRPGPLGSGMVDDFILRKKGRQAIDYFHPDLKACLEPTYGVIVYQEQVMQISQIIGGYTLGGADLLRRAMGKKKPEEMARHRETFSQGAVAKGYDAGLAMRLFDLMEKFAEYGFNKSHTAAYAVVTYHTAWLKAHHTAAFMAATLSSDLDNTDSVKVYVDDARKNGLTILPPDVNRSGYRFVPVDRKRIRYGLGAIKGTGEGAIASLVACREEGGAFTDLFDFCRRVDRRIVNRRVIEALVRAGAFDGLHADRNAACMSVGLALEWAETRQLHAAQGSLFGDTALDAPPELVCVPPWSPRERLTQEKTALGFYFSGHPFDADRSLLQGLMKGCLKDVRPQPHAQLLAGVVAAVRTQMTRRGKMAYVTLDDGQGQVEVALFTDLYDANRARIREDALLLVAGKVSLDDYSGGLRAVADEVLDPEEARTRFATRLHLTLADGLAGSVDAHRLMQALAPYRDERGCALSLGYRNVAASCELILGPAWRLRLADDLLAALGGFGELETAYSVVLKNSRERGERIRAVA